MRYSSIFKFVALAGIASITTMSCKKEKSSATGWNYNDPKWGGFQSYKAREQETGPGLVFIQGGTFTMGTAEQDVTYEHDNIERRVTVNSFYMDQTEVENKHYLEYLYWLNRVFLESPDVYKKALPDTLVWRDKLAFNEPYVQLYLRHPAYQHYPVVGVSWVQATGYASWRTDRVNEMILVRDGILKVNPQQQDRDNFNTEAYLQGQYQGAVKKNLKDMNPSGTRRQVRLEDGVLLPEYRLPTEAEWEYAALALIGNSQYENIYNKRIYSWDGLTVRHMRPERDRGLINANFKRGKGDNAGTAGKLNDEAFVPIDVISYWPNDFGLYNMAGNVSEWVMDVYRPLSYEDMSDFNPFRGNEFKTKLLDADGYVMEKDSLGRIIYVPVDEKDNVNRRNYKKSDNIGYKDELTYNDGSQQYEYGVSSLIDNRVRVYKGGSWNDRAYWMSPGTRRYLDENQSTAYLGFRCAMFRVGDPVGNR